MLLALFRSNQASASLLLFIYALVVQLPFILFPGSGDFLPTGGYFGLTWSVGLGGPTLAGLLLAALCLTITGIAANVSAQRHNMARNITQFPGLFVLLCWALVPAAHYFHPVQPALVCLAFAVLALGRVYKRDEPAVPLVNVGLWLGLGSLFYPKLLWVYPALVFGIGILRTPDLRSILQPVVGVLIVLFLVGSWAYFRGQGSAFLAAQFGGLGWYGLLPAGQYDLLGATVLGLLLLFALVSAGTTVRLLNIEGSKSVSILYWLLMSCLPVLAFGGVLSVGELGLLSLPLGMLLGLRLSATSGPTAELVHLLLFAAALALSVLSLLR